MLGGPLSDVERYKNTVKDLRERLAEIEGEQGMIDLKKIAATYKKRRKNSILCSRSRPSWGGNERGLMRLAQQLRIQ